MTNGNDKQLPLTNIRQKLDSAKSILIILPYKHNIDKVAAGLSLYLSLSKYFQEENKNKTISLASGNDMTVAYQRLYGIDRINKNIGSKNLVISLKTNPDNIENVSYDSDDSHFNLVVEMRKGQKRLEKNQVDFSYRGIDSDLIITVGLENTDQAGKVLGQDNDIFKGKEVINICAGPRASAFGTINVIDQKCLSSCEIIAKLVRFLKFPVDPDICTNLVAGIESITNNFAIGTNADTFAAISWCMHQGGRRNHLSAPLGQQPGFAAPGFARSNNLTFQQGMPSVPQPVPVSPPISTPNPQAAEPEEEFVEQAEEVSGEDVPSDWLQPKIYKGNQA